MKNGKRLKVLIPAAGKGERSGLSYPKTLKIFDGIPILIRTLQTVLEIDRNPVVIVSPQGEKLIKKTIREYGNEAELLVQKEPCGLGDAILCFRKSEYFNKTDEVLVVWGDMISVQIETLRRLIFLFRKNGLTFAFPSKVSNPCYTYVERNEEGKVIALSERMEFGDELPLVGESDIGVFIFNKIVFDILTSHQESLIGKSTNEIGFLPIVSILSGMGHSIDAFKIADEIDSLSFNTIHDLRKAEEILC
jgi:bifunctional N-acetylglucosamine-1-phosphate-uridyltransferase/glucosamine-1-phosphate-acetyltransferase GlmU-like protein